MPTIIIKLVDIVRTGALLPLFTSMALLWYITNVSGATINSASPSFQDVANAVSQASDGDSVVIPAGSATWSSILTIRKSIALIGAGYNSTIITRGSGFSDPIIQISDLSADVPVRVSGIFFDNVVYGVGGDRMAIQILNSFGSSWGYTKIRIDNCKFNAGERQVSWKNWAYGVVDHCYFQNANIMVYVQGDDNYAWLRPIVPGTTNAVYIETNNFHLDNSVYDPGSWIYHQEGGRSVTRYNTFDSSSYTLTNDVQFYDCHGNQNYFAGNNSDFRGTVMVEVYNNTFHVGSTYRMMYLRGGSDLVYNNTFTVDTGSLPAILNMSEEEGWNTGFFSPLRTTWPAEDQINNCFFWGNTINGRSQAPGDFATWNDNDGTFIQQGRDYWLQAPDRATVTTYPNPGYPSSSSYSNRYASITSYTPLVYPHPLVTGQVPTATTPAPPSGLRIVQ